jgi:predicted DNA-binding transcriptional regulator AlpA
VEHKLRTMGKTGTNSALLSPTSAAPVILTVQQVAERLQIPASSIYERTRYRAAQNSIPVIPHRRVGKYLRFLASEVDAWFLSLPQSTKTAKRRYRRTAA